MTGELILQVDGLAARYGRRDVFHDASFEVRTGQVIGVVGPNGAGKTTLLRALTGLITPAAGSIRIAGLEPRMAVTRVAVGYFGGESTLPGGVCAAAWSRVGGGDAVCHDRCRIRKLSHGSRQSLGLRTALARDPLRLVVLDEPWEGLDPDAARWLSAILAAKRDEGAAVVVSSHRLHDLSRVCDFYLFLIDGRATVVQPRDVSPVGPVTAARLMDVFDRLRGGHGLRFRPEPIRRPTRETAP